MNSTIPLLGGEALCSGEGAFQFFLIILRKILKKRIKDEILTLSKHKKVVLLALTVLDGYFFYLILSSSLDVKPIKQEQVTHQE
jgi:hypothetical protein